MEENKTQVYIQTDENGLVLRCEGGYTMSNITDVSEWILIDEGTGDRYNLCQSHYFDGGLFTEDGVSLYKWDGEKALRRSGAEIAADRAAAAAVQARQARLAELHRLLADTDYAVIKIAEGAATAEEYADVIAQRQAWRTEINELEGNGNG